ncbi:hypothetical protein K377_07869 [Streptomyces sp. PsTaAH-137]|nr:hypothetical protein K377_07869 [Streptomyces sp. PsTaAH-137]
MSGRPSTGEAVGLLESELRAARETRADLGAEDVWRAFLRFGRVRFDTPDTPDVDGLLFQYGTHAFDAPATFTLDFTRQFDVIDSDGEHDHYVQVHCELRYGLAPALQDLGSFNSWFFHDVEDDLDHWAQALRNQPVWTAISALKPAETRVYQEPV